MYKQLIRPLLFSIDSEWVHDFSFQIIQIVQTLKLESLISKFTTACFDPKLSVNIKNLKFPNPVGLAAGFDKQALGFNFFEALGFGAIEVGTITSKFQYGNPKPRIFRLNQDQAIINRLGFPSEGIDVILDRVIKIYKNLDKKSVLGINIGKAKDVALEDASVDYLNIFKKICDFADYVTINVSSPNTPELRKLQDPSRLKELFELINSCSLDKKPLVFVKLSPDIELSYLEPIVKICLDTKLDGLIATNTTTERPNDLQSPKSLILETGGLSGRPLFKKAINFVSTLSEVSQKQLSIIAVGGIFSADDVLMMLKAGATTTQIYTALVYEGPMIVNSICKDLLSKMIARNCANLSELVNQ